MKKKILIIIPSLVGGGAERVLINLLKRFDYSHYEIDLLVGFNTGIYFSEIPPEVKVKILFNNKTIGRILIMIFRKTGLVFPVKLIMDWKIRDCYDVGISFIDSQFTDFLISQNAKLKKKIAFVHASFNTYDRYKKFQKGKYKERIINSRYGNLDSIIFVSNDSKDEFMKVFGNKYRTEVIYNIMDVDRIKVKAGESSDIKFNKDRINIIAVGSLIPVKSYDKLILAANKLKKDGLNFKIHILGTGYLKKSLEQLIKSLNLEEYIELLGFRSNPYSLMNQSDVFVMTSISEALPTAHCEAMILGLPCIVTDCSGCRELVENGKFGMLVGQTIDDIYFGLKEMISNDELRVFYGRRSLERAKIFNDTSSLEKIYSILNS